MTANPNLASDQKSLGKQGASIDVNALLRDRDASYGSSYRRQLNVMGIRDRLVAARSPWQNGYVERVIGSIRREYLNQVIVFNERHLRRLLCRYAEYYNGYRTHLGLTKDPPESRPIHAIGDIFSRPFLGGLHHAYLRTE